MRLLESKISPSAIVLVFVVASVMLLPKPCSAATPSVISYQGRILVSSAPFSGTGLFRFALVDSVTTNIVWNSDNGGTTAPTTDISIPVSNGLYSVLIGNTSATPANNYTMAALPATLFANNNPLSLRVYFNDGTNGSKQLAPDQVIAAVGYAMVANSVNTTDTTSNPIVSVTQNGSSQAIHAINGASDAVGFANAGRFEITNANNISTSVFALSNSNQGHAFQGYMTGLAPCCNFQIANASNTMPCIFAQTTGTGSVATFNQNGSGGIMAANSSASNGEGIVVVLNNTNNIQAAVHAITKGTGFAIVGDQEGNPLNGGIAAFQAAGVTKARIDNTGKGFFNGGTQTGGADVAEAFSVIGDRNQYEPGDVLILSTEKDRTVLKSSEAYSPLVSGVYATKPGVLLTERNIDADTSDLVPMGVVGVIPTKVCTENGAIKIGDMLVTSSTPGHAMKGTDRDRMMGAVIGKALQNFDGATPGKIKVLVNVK